MSRFRRHRDTDHREEWVFPVGFIVFWVVGAVIVLAVGLALLLL